MVCSDEIHCDLLLDKDARHLPYGALSPSAAERSAVMMAPSKTFNIAGAHIGNLIVADADLRKALQGRMTALGISPGLFGLGMVAAAYSPEGAEWVDQLVAYLDGNRRLFDDGVNAIAGLRSMPLESTREEFTARVEKSARIAANHGTSFGLGGDSFLRFNIATPRARVAEAVARLQKAFGDLQ